MKAVIFTVFSAMLLGMEGCILSEDPPVETITKVDTLKIVKKDTVYFDKESGKILQKDTVIIKDTIRLVRTDTLIKRDTVKSVRIDTIYTIKKDTTYIIKIDTLKLLTSGLVSDSLYGVWEGFVNKKKITISLTKNKSSYHEFEGVATVDGSSRVFYAKEKTGNLFPIVYDGYKDANWIVQVSNNQLLIEEIGSNLFGGIGAQSYLRRI